MISTLCRTVAVITCCLSFAVSTSEAGNWPRFRGPNGTGIAEGDVVPVEWKAEHRLWKIAIPGDGNSSPVVWGNRLFVQSAEKDRRLLLCIDVEKGEVAWTRSVKGTPARTHRKNTLASATPAVDGKRVVAAFWDGRVILINAYDFSGNLLWSQNLGPVRFQHGAGASPIIHKGRVYFVNDYDGAPPKWFPGKSTVCAFDAESGKLLWKSERKGFRTCYGAPFVWERNGNEELVVASTMEVTAHDPATGAVRWRWEWKHPTKRPLRVTGSPVFAGTTVYASSGDGGGDRYMVAVGVDGNGGEPKLIWSDRRVFPYVPTMLSYRGLLFFANDYGRAGCYDAKSGKKIWEETLSDSAFTASPVIAGGKIYAADEAGDMYVFDASPKFHVHARNSIGERIRATPAIANNRIYVRGQYHLYCIGQR